MQRFRIFISALLYSFFLFNLYSQESSFSIEEMPALEESSVSGGEFNLLEAKKFSLTDTGRTKITVKSNVSDAAVYLNGQLEGNTTLIINDLPEGRYNLKVEKSGWETKRCRIQVRKGQEAVYYIELEKYRGQVSFYSEPQDTQLYIDGQKISEQTVFLQEGSHTLEAKKFGFKTQTADFYVYRHSYQLIRIKLAEAPFEISNLRVNRTSFNPALPGTPGKIKFYFSVTNKGSADFKILDSSKNEVLDCSLPDFNFWEQSVTWDGKTSSGICSDGTYTAVISSGDKSLSINFNIDSSIRLPWTSVTSSGSGTGTLPQALHYPKDTLNLGFSSGAFLTDKENTFYGSPVNFHLLYSLSEHAELTLKAGTLIKKENSSANFNTALKFTFENKGEAVDFNWGFLLRAGGASNRPYPPYGADNGSGAGGGIVLGLKGNAFYTGLSSEFVFAPSTYNTADSNYDKVWKNGISFTLSADNFSAGLFAALHSSFGTTGLSEDDRKDSSADFTRAVEGGIDLHFFPFSYPLFFNLKSSLQIINCRKYFKTEAGMYILL